MEELLKQTPAAFRTFKRGQEIEGIVVEKTKQAIYVDIGGKSEGMVIDREMKAAKDYIDGLKAGDKITAIVTQAENEAGHTLLSLKKAAANSIWRDFEEKGKTGEVLRVTGKEVNRGGLVVEIRGLAGFIPASQFSATWQGKIDQLINRQIEVKVIEVNRSTNRLIFSEKEVSEAQEIKEQAKALAQVKVGDVYEGAVSGVMSFGLFVKIKVAAEAFLEGLVHISEISWEKVENPGDSYKVGDKVEVKVLAIDKKSAKLNFSIKKLLEDPWEKIEAEFPLDSKVKGEVIKVAPFGLFVRLKPGIEALIHVSKVPAEKSFKVGQMVDCFVESVDKATRKMSLGLVLKEKPVGYK